ncbi:HD-GYP domain-containing protein [Paraglaciecola arctica]|uniref:HD-GYP domain-containing protein n=1 Tax=Paraglaciecola arctica TaxID=1128911 RepID=UPI001C06A69E|nr:HD-GYP domain-containing protein [Paraglaciecola arctica]
MLKTFDIDELEEGMFVDSIAKQQGTFKITSRGRVNSKEAIKQLKNKGILSVVVDMSKQLKSEVVEPETPEQEPEAPVEISFEEELEVATKLHTKGKQIQKTMLESISKKLPIDIAIPEAFTNNLVSSIDRNPNALMCMTKIREKDTYLLEHSLNVAILLANFGSHVGLAEEQVQELALSGFLHDIGKIKIPDHILHKPGRLTDQEMTIMKDHVYYGTKVLIEMGIPESIVETIGQHHERLDGYGYPDGLRGDEITQFGRMIAIVDTYDAITADRCYKVGMSSKKALQILVQDSPEKYDGELVKQFVQCIGIFPVGSLVKLNNEKIAMVLKQHPVHGTKPVVKVFYSIRGNHYVEPKEVNLATVSNGVKIVDAVIASDFKLDFNKYFNESIAI